MKVLIAPDKFKHALDATDVAAAMAEGVRSARPDAETILCPLGDGGEGTGRILATALAAAEQTAEVRDPLGRPRPARWWLAPDGPTAVIEMAEASGLQLLTDRERDATRTTSYGTGQLLAAAVAAGCRQIKLCVGGSATVDGGAGCLQALGWQALDPDGRPIVEPLTGGTLARVARLLPPEPPPSLALDVLCDVDNPLLGRRGAARVYAPQKGADARQVRRLENALRHWARLLEHLAGRDCSTLPGTGAAGGLPAGLAAALGARLLPGFDAVAGRLGLRKLAERCDLIFTGEGRLDEQTGQGKVVAGVARLGTQLDKPVVAFVGATRPPGTQCRARLSRRLGLSEIVVITPPAIPHADALAQTRVNLCRAVASYLRTTR